MLGVRCWLWDGGPSLCKWLPCYYCRTNRDDADLKRRLMVVQCQDWRRERMVDLERVTDSRLLNPEHDAITREKFTKYVT